MSEGGNVKAEGKKVFDEINKDDYPYDLTMQLQLKLNNKKKIRPWYARQQRKIYWKIKRQRSVPENLDPIAPLFKKRVKEGMGHWRG